MRNRLFDHIKNLFIPCVGLSMAAGFSSAVIITLFKLCAEAVIHLSASIYGEVRANALWLPLLVLGAAALGLAASFFHSLSHSCRGGGIPSSVAAIRGILNFKWRASIFVLPFSALISFLSGLPLGTEGPCVQLGTAIGDGVISCFPSKKHRGWRRYIMTGGAAAGFSIATSSPVTAIIFAMEELHKHFSPLLMLVASISVMTAEGTLQALSSLGIGSLGLFHIPAIQSIDANHLFAPLIIGIICGVGAILFSCFYQQANKTIHSLTKKVSVKILFPLLFAFVSIIGFFISDSLGTGHSLIEKLFSVQKVWYVLILVFLIRAIIMTISNTAGVTGGIFLPTLSFGALIGSLCGKALIALGWIGPEHYILTVVLGMASFLGAMSRIPVTACVFAIEALGAFNNAPAVIIAVTVSLLVVELFKIEDFTDTVIEAKTRSINKGKAAIIVDVPLKVNKNAFVAGKELSDVLWPNSCFVVSFERAPEHRGIHEILEGDVITLRYKTYNPSVTADELTALVGEQSEEIKKLMDPA